MGSRGAFDEDYGKNGGIPEDRREYSCIGILGHIKVIQCDTKSNNSTMTYSNTKNTTYFSYSKEHHRIEKIYYYRNHKLIKSVDIYGKKGPHAHYWHSQDVGRKKHDKKNIYPLSLRDKRLVDLAIKYNQGKL